MHKALYPRDNVDRLYVSLNKQWRGHASIEDSFYASIEQLEDYIEKPDDDWLKPSERERQHDGRQNDNNYETNCEEKQLIGRFKQLINNISPEKHGPW